MSFYLDQDLVRGLCDEYSAFLTEDNELLGSLEKTLAEYGSDQELSSQAVEASRTVGEALLEGNSQTLTAVISMLRDAEYRSSINGSLKESLESFCESLGVIRRDLFIADAEGGQIFAG